jgi:prophage regulatory protein
MGRFPYAFPKPLIGSLYMNDYDNEDNNENEANERAAFGPRCMTTRDLLSSHAGARPIERLLRLPEVLAIVPVGRSTWYEGVRQGAYPQPVRLSTRTVAWPEDSIRTLVQRIANGH